jgi:hypothetical protein
MRQYRGSGPRRTDTPDGEALPHFAGGRCRISTVMGKRLPISPDTRLVCDCRIDDDAAAAFLYFILVDDVAAAVSRSQFFICLFYARREPMPAKLYYRDASPDFNSSRRL